MSFRGDIFDSLKMMHDMKFLSLSHKPASRIQPLKLMGEVIECPKEGNFYLLPEDGVVATTLDDFKRELRQIHGGHECQWLLV